MDQFKTHMNKIAIVASETYGMVTTFDTCELADALIDGFESFNI